MPGAGHVDVDGDTEVTWQLQLRLDAEATRRLVTTCSDWSGREVDQPARAVTEPGGTVVEDHRSRALVLRPVRTGG